MTNNHTHLNAEDGLNPDEANLIATVKNSFATVTPDPQFVNDLLQQLTDSHRQTQHSQRISDYGGLHKSTIMYHLRNSSHHFVRRTSVIIALLCALIVIPVLGKTLLDHYAPREVARIPMPISTAAAPTPQSRSTITDLARIEEQIGHRILQPTYLPANCGGLRERFAYADIRVAVLRYGCVGIEQQVNSGIQQPYVGTGASQSLTVNGQPAIYINGIWVQDKPGGKLTWRAGDYHELIFEQNGLTIRLSASTEIAKEELVRIAESMK